MEDRQLVTLCWIISILRLTDSKLTMNNKDVGSYASSQTWGFPELDSKGMHFPEMET